MVLVKNKTMSLRVVRLVTASDPEPAHDLLLHNPSRRKCPMDATAV